MKRTITRILAVVLALCLLAGTVQAHRFGTRRALLGVGEEEISYLLRATFDAADQGYSNTQVLDDPSEGIEDGQLTVVEVDGTLAIVSNKCAFTAQGTPTWGDLGFYSQAITRALGRGLLGVVQKPANDIHGPAVGFADSIGLADDAFPAAIYFRGTGNFHAVDGRKLFVATSIFPYLAATDYQIAIIQGGYHSNRTAWYAGQVAANYLYGMAIYTKGGTLSTWTLLWKWDADNTGTLYVAISGSEGVPTIDNFRVPDRDLSAVLQPTCLSTFTAANSTDLDALSPEVGGTWTEQSGDWEVSANQITPTTDNTEHIATVDSGISDAIVDAVVEISTDAGGLEHGIVLRFSDTSTYWKVSVNATNNDVGLWEINAGVTERANTAVVINTATDYAVRAIADGQTIDAFVDGSNKISYGSAANNENETEHGLYTYFNVAADFADFDNFAVFARTSSVYDATLDD